LALREQDCHLQLVHVRGLMPVNATDWLFADGVKDRSLMTFADMEVQDAPVSIRAT
jgi:hypothetical protein